MADVMDAGNQRAKMFLLSFHLHVIYCGFLDLGELSSYLQMKERIIAENP